MKTKIVTRINLFTTSSSSLSYKFLLRPVLLNSRLLDVFKVEFKK